MVDRYGREVQVGHHLLHRLKNITVVVESISNDNFTVFVRPVDGGRLRSWRPLPQNIEIVGMDLEFANRAATKIGRDTDAFKYR